MTYPTNEVTLFLAQRYPWRSRHFAESHVHVETVDSLTTERWFRSYFPSEKAFQLHKGMELWIGNRQWIDGFLIYRLSNWKFKKSDSV